MARNQAELRRQVAELLKRPENKECADCTERLPKWAVVNHGIFVCLNCSGQHRNIGAHISKVKSATLDDWEPEEVAFMAKMGNAKANSILLANLPAGMSKPQSSDDRGRERWIKQKYVQRKWVGDPRQQATQEQAPTVVRPSQPAQQPAYNQIQQPPQQKPVQAQASFSSFTYPSATTSNTATVNQVQRSPAFSAPSNLGFNQQMTASFVPQPAPPSLSSFFPEQPGFNQSYQGQQKPQPVSLLQMTSLPPAPERNGMLIDFGTTVPSKSVSVDPNARDKLLECLGGGNSSSW